MKKFLYLILLVFLSSCATLAQVDDDVYYQRNTVEYVEVVSQPLLYVDFGLSFYPYDLYWHYPYYNIWYSPYHFSYHWYHPYWIHWYPHHWVRWNNWTSCYYSYYNTNLYNTNLYYGPRINRTGSGHTPGQEGRVKREVPRPNPTERYSKNIPKRENKIEKPTSRDTYRPQSNSKQKPRTYNAPSPARTNPRVYSAPSPRGYSPPSPSGTRSRSYSPSAPSGTRSRSYSPSAPSSTRSRSTTPQRSTQSRSTNTGKRR